MGACASTSMPTSPTPLPPSSLASTRVTQISAEYAALRADIAASCAPSISADASHERVMKGKRTARWLHSFNAPHQDSFVETSNTNGMFFLALPKSQTTEEAHSAYQSFPKPLLLFTRVPPAAATHSIKTAIPLSISRSSKLPPLRRAP